MPEAAGQIIERTETMVAGRTNFDAHWQEIRDFINNTHPAFTSPIEVPGTKTRGQIWSNKAERASEQLANGLDSLLTNPGTEWFTLRARQDELNEDYEAAVWLEDAARKMRAVFDSPASRFGTQKNKIYRTLADFGTACLYVRERPGRLPVFQSRPLSELYLGEDEDGQVNRVHRKFCFTPGQAVAFFGADNLSAEIRQAAETPGKARDEYEFIHAVYPRAERLAGVRLATNLPIASDWVDTKAKDFVRRSGYHEMPLITPRWAVKEGEVFGRSVGMKALADVKALQETMKLTFRAAQKTVSPPLQVADDGLGGPVRTKPDAVNYVDSALMARGHGGILPVHTGANPQLGLELVEYIGREIEADYFVYLLQISRDPRMTATQVIEITEEMLRTLGPFLQSQIVELLGPVIKRAFGILSRIRGFFRPLPPVLAQAPLRVEYLSPVVKAQRLAEVRAISQAEEVTQMMVARDAAVADNLDHDEAFRHVYDRLGVPRSLLVPVRRVQALRKQRQELAQQQQMVEQAAALAPAAQSMGQAVAALRGPRGGAENREAA